MLGVVVAGSIDGGDSGGGGSHGGDEHWKRCCSTPCFMKVQFVRRDVFFGITFIRGCSELWSRKVILEYARETSRIYMLLLCV